MFKKLVCSLLLNIHPICTAKWSHPMCIQPISKYYFNIQRIFSEYAYDSNEYRKHNEKYASIINLNKALMYTIEHVHNPNVIKVLLYYGAKIHINVFRCLYDNLSISRDTRSFRALLEYGIDIPDKNDNALISAVRGSHVRIVKLLLKHGANVNTQNDQALISAIENSNLDIVRLLLEYGADIHAQNDQVLISAIKYSNMLSGTEIVQLLLEYGADANAHDGQALIRAIDRGSLAIIKLLLNNGADITMQNAKAMQIISKNPYVQIWQFLSDHIERKAVPFKPPSL